MSEKKERVSSLLNAILKPGLPAESLENQHPGLPNCTELGLSYDMAEFSPIPLRHAIKDNGRKKRVFMMEDQDFEDISDSKYSKPVGTDHVFLDTTSINFAKHSIYTYNEYEKHISSNRSYSIGIKDLFKFGRSPSRSYYIKEIEEKEKYWEFTRNNFEFYGLGLGPLSEATTEGRLLHLSKASYTLGDSFLENVVNLALELNTPMDFIKSMGTHYCWSITMGGEIYGLHILSKENYLTLEGKTINISKQAEVTHKDLTGEKSADRENQEYQEYQRNSELEEGKLIVRGGTPALNPSEWVESVRDAPVVVGFASFPLDELFDKDLLEDQLTQYLENKPGGGDIDVEEVIQNLTSAKDALHDEIEKYLNDVYPLPLRARAIFLAKTDEDSRMMDAEYTEDCNWRDITTPAGNNHKTDQSPGLAFFERDDEQGEKVLYYVSAVETHLKYAKSPRPGWWTPAKKLGSGNSHQGGGKVGLAVFNKKLYALFGGLKNEYIYWTHFDGINWSSAEKISAQGHGDYKMSKGGDLVTHGDRMFYVSVSVGGKSLWQTVFDKKTGRWSKHKEIIRELEESGNLGTTCPSLAVFNQKLWLVYRYSNNTVRISSYDDKNDVEKSSWSKGKELLIPGGDAIQTRGNLHLFPFTGANDTESLMCLYVTADRMYMATSTTNPESQLQWEEPKLVTGYRSTEGKVGPCGIANGFVGENET